MECQCHDLDGGTFWKPDAFTVETIPATHNHLGYPPPGTWNTTVLFTILGTNFQSANKTTVTIYKDVTTPEVVLPTTYTQHYANDNYRQVSKYPSSTLTGCL